MNRRNFISALATLIAGGESGINILAGAGRKWKRARQGLWMLNPDYVDAPYEIGTIQYRRDGTLILGHTICYFDRSVGRPDNLLPEIYPMRFRNYIDCINKQHPVPPVIET